MKKTNKDSYIIFRVTALEKEYVLKACKKAKVKKISTFVRISLGLEK